MSADSLLLRGELRGEKRLYLLAALTTMLASAALTLTLAINTTFERSFAAAAKTLLGGDISIRLRQRNFTPQEINWLRQNTRKLSFITTAGMVALVGDNSQMARIKAIDDAYPLYGNIKLQNGDYRDLQATLAKTQLDDDIYPAAVGAELLTLFAINVGDVFNVAGKKIRITHVIEREPDPDPRLWMAAPPVLVGAKAAARFSAAGALYSNYGRAIINDDESAEQWQARLTAAFPNADWRVRNAQDAMPALRRFIRHTRDFLSIMSLAAILIAGIGVGGAALAFLNARAGAIAIVKMLGGKNELITSVYLKISALFIIGGAFIGAIIGGGLLFIITPYLSSALPWQLAPQWPWESLGKTLFITALIGMAFALLPTLNAARANPLTLFNASGFESSRYTRRDAFIGVALWSLILIVIPLPLREKIIATGILFLAAIIYFMSIGFARLAGLISRRLPPPFSWGFLSLSRSPRRIATGIVSLGMGMAMLVAILNASGNFSARIDDTLRQAAPTFYLLGIAKQQRQELENTLAAVSDNARLRAIPFMRGKIKSIGEQDADSIIAPLNLRWILSGDRGLTWTEDGGYIGNSRVSAGTLWDKKETRPQASFDAEAAAAFGINLGDELVLNILGRPLTVIITSFRDIEWQNFDINFVIILDRQPFGSAPYSLMAAAFLPAADEAAAKLAIIRKFPNITPISMRAVFDIGQRLLKSVAILLQAAAIFILMGAIPVIIASLMDSQRQRIHDAITLRLLGASNKTLILKGLSEFAAMAAVALLPALIFGLIFAKIIVEHIFDLTWRIGDGSPLIVVLSAVILFTIIGCLSVARWISQPPLSVIRND